MRRGGLLDVLLLAVAFIPLARAQEQPLGAPQPDRTLRDPEFGVVARHLGLERQVAMLQWQVAGSRYVRVWSETAIDSASFAPGHSNPVALPLQGQRWLPGTISVDGRPLDAEVVRSLGQWQDFRPSFSALPGNLAATFQPEGNGLGSADNPLAPRIGDLRVHWRELVLPSLDGRIALRDGRWRLVAEPPPDPTAAPAKNSSLAGSISRNLMWWLTGLAVMILAAVLMARLRRRP
ncbi:MAG: hypothetical protein JWL98_1843 [Xanthomonadaceae bacterium]|nr:hypothetical protein [Xanthomonadaceae bacterium]